MLVPERLRNSIRIVEIPPGEAPLKIRKEWVETTIPTSRTYADIVDKYFPGLGDQLPDDSDIHKGRGSFGIESGLPNDENDNGYAVNASDAIAALEAKGTKDATNAARYWRVKLSNFGSLKGKQLIFSRKVCELLSQNNQSNLED